MFAAATTAAKPLTERQKKAYLKFGKGKPMACDPSKKNPCPKLFTQTTVDGKCVCIPQDVQLPVQTVEVIKEVPVSTEVPVQVQCPSLVYPQDANVCYNVVQDPSSSCPTIQTVACPTAPTGPIISPLPPGGGGAALLPATGGSTGGAIALPGTDTGQYNWWDNDQSLYDWTPTYQNGQDKAWDLFYPTEELKQLQEPIATGEISTPIGRANLGQIPGWAWIAGAAFLLFALRR